MRDKIKFWEDSWVGRGPLDQRFPKLL